MNATVRVHGNEGTSVWLTDGFLIVSGPQRRSVTQEEQLWNTNTHTACLQTVRRLIVAMYWIRISRHPAVLLVCVWAAATTHVCFRWRINSVCVCFPLRLHRSVEWALLLPLGYWVSPPSSSLVFVFVHWREYLRAEVIIFRIESNL